MIVPVVEIVSNLWPRFHAAIVPIHKPMMIDKMVDVPTRTSVGQTRSIILSRTGWLYCAELPKSRTRRFFR